MKTTINNIALGIISLFVLLQVGGCGLAAAPIGYYVAPVATATAVEAIKDPKLMNNIGNSISNFIGGIKKSFSGPTEAKAEERPIAWRDPDKRTTLPRILPGKKKVRLAPPPAPESSDPTNETAPAGHNSPAKKEQIIPLSI